MQYFYIFCEGDKKENGIFKGGVLYFKMGVGNICNVYVDLWLLVGHNEGTDGYLDHLEEISEIPLYSKLSASHIFRSAYFV